MNSRLAAKFLHSNIHHSNCKYTHNHEIKWQEDSWHEQPTCICTQNWASQTLPLNWWTQNTTSEPSKFILSLSRSLSLRYVKKKCQTKHPKGTTSSSLDTSNANTQFFLVVLSCQVLFCFVFVLFWLRCWVPWEMCGDGGRGKPYRKNVNVRMMGFAGSKGGTVLLRRPPPWLPIALPQNPNQTETNTTKTFHSGSFVAIQIPHLLLLSPLDYVHPSSVSGTPHRQTGTKVSGRA